MSTIKTIEIGMGLTIQPVAYEGIRADVRLGVELAPGDDVTRETDELRTALCAQLEETVAKAYDSYNKIQGRETVVEDTEEDDWEV